ncbi:site-specific integrase [Phyllobacterium sp. A18/5-2]|uniref:tyrosine-type recombinase/integrase n=1 Tax=Phyllobacterium sp. A18/5-2 TaxID=2978392 RepID=UPI0021C985F1|nr:site-specific integrase [Phyllobacterium sp. A18/5-2]UXN62884.1 site-specific integrase [Phyllobacterium sp. A18/5-2]
MKKASTIATDRGRIERHIKPLLGSKRVGEITSQDISKFLRDVANGKTATDIKTKKRGRSIVKGGKGTATRTVRLLGGIFTWAMSENIRKDNPVATVTKFPDNSGERYLTSTEMAKLGEAIREAETIGIAWKESTSKHTPKKNRRTVVDKWAAGAIRLLIFTGCRLSEILHLAWRDVDLERGLLFLPDSKTGRKTVVLSRVAQDVLTSIERVGIYVIASESAGQEDEKPRSDLKRPWAMIRRRAALDGLRLHDLRHSFASVGAGGGMGLPIIGKLLGHSQAATTARYAHLDADPVRRAADAISDKIEKAMEEGK